MSALVDTIKSLFSSGSRAQQDNSGSRKSGILHNLAGDQNATIPAEQPPGIHVSSSQPQRASMPGSGGAISDPTVTRSRLRGSPHPKRDFLQRIDPDSYYAAEDDTNEVIQISKPLMNMDIYIFLHHAIIITC